MKLTKLTKLTKQIFISRMASGGKERRKNGEAIGRGGKTRYPWPAAAFFEKKCLPRHTMEGIVLRKNQSTPKGHPAATETQKRTCIKLHIALIWELADSYILLYSKKKYKNNKRRKIIKKDKEYRAGKRITLHKKRQK